MPLSGKAIEDKEDFALLHTRLREFVLIVIVAAIAAAVPVSAAKPVIEQDVLPIAPESVAEFWDTSEVVARVRIEESRVRGIGTTPLVVTEHRATVLRVFKGNLKPGCTVAFEQAAGELELPDKIIRVAGAVPLAVQHDYIVFLRQWPAAGAFSLVGDRAGAFKIVRGVVEPQGGGAVAEEHRNLSERRFIDELERAATRRPEVR